MTAHTEPMGVERLLLNAGKLFTADQLAQVLQVPKSWIYEQSRQWQETDGETGLPTVTLGRYRRYDGAAVYAWIQDGGSK